MKYPKEFERHWNNVMKAQDEWVMKDFYFKGWKIGVGIALKKTQKVKKYTGGNYQHEDIDWLIEDLEELIKNNE